MKMPNSYGSVTKLSGKRRNPYMVRLAASRVSGERKVLGYYHTKADALAALAEYNENPYNIVDANMTLQQVWDNIKDTVKASEDRKKVYNTAMEKYIKDISHMKLKDIKTVHLQSVLDNCGHGYSTKSNIRTVLKHIYAYAMQNDLVKQDYTQYIEFEQEAVQIERVIYTQEEIARLWIHKDLEEYATTLILLHQGMRIKELRDCTKDWIDLDARTIDIKQAKNKQSIRKVPIHDKVFELIKTLYDNSPDEHIVHFKKNQYEYFVKNVLKHTPYDARHTFASKANELNMKTVVIQRIIGHKPDTLLEQVYIHLTIDELREAMNTVKYD